MTPLVLSGGERAISMYEAPTQEKYQMQFPWQGSCTFQRTKGHLTGGLWVQPVLSESVPGCWRGGRAIRGIMGITSLELPGHSL